MMYARQIHVSTNGTYIVLHNFRLIAQNTEISKEFNQPTLYLMTAQSNDQWWHHRQCRMSPIRSHCTTRTHFQPRAIPRHQVGMCRLPAGTGWHRISARSSRLGDWYSVGHRRGVDSDTVPCLCHSSVPWSLRRRSRIPNNPAQIY